MSSYILYDGMCFLFRKDDQRRLIEAKPCSCNGKGMASSTSDGTQHEACDGCCKPEEGVREEGKGKRSKTEHIKLFRNQVYEYCQPRLQAGSRLGRSQAVTRACVSCRVAVNVASDSGGSISTDSGVTISDD